MHMSDALLSPVVGGVMTAVSVGAIGYSVKKVSGDASDEKKIPMMGVMGAFVFAAQMVNFTIPGTGSSGHIGGGILLAALLGPFPALLTVASVLLIQCLFFADGGLLAYGCNVFNIGVCSCLFAYGLVYRPIIKKGLNKRNIIIASILCAVLGLQAGAFAVVLETTASGVAGLPFGMFALLMQPIHLVIGIAEGIVTAAVLCFILSVRPELLGSAVSGEKISRVTSLKRVIITFAILAALIGGGISLFASSLPDGLEWSIMNASSRTGSEFQDDEPISIALMPGYAFPIDGDEEDSHLTNLGTATAGIIGGAVTVLLAGGAGLVIHLVRRRNSGAE